MRLISKIIGNQEKPVSNSGDFLGSSITLNGNPLSFSKDTAGLASNTVITLEPIQAGSGDPSPSNVRAISGYDSIIISPNSDSTNLFNKKDLSTSGYIASDGSITPNTGWCVSNYMKVSGTTVSYFGLSNPGTAPQLAWYDEDFNFLSAASQSTGTVHLTIPNDAKFLRMSLYKVIPTTNEDTLMVYLGDSESVSYQAYNSSTDLSIDMPGTVYGGTLDVESGELVVDMAYQQVPSTGWARDKANVFVAASTCPIPKASTMYDVPKAVCDHYKIDNVYNIDYTSGSNAISVIKYNTTDMRFWIKDSRFDTKGALESELSSNPVYIAYELETPITYHLTPHQVALLQGANVVTTNGISISLTHRQGQIAAQEDLVALAESVNGMDKENESLIYTANGSETVRWYLNTIFRKLDKSKLTNKSRIRYGNDWFTITYFTGSSIVCEVLFLNPTTHKPIIKSMQLLSSGSNRWVLDSDTWTDESENIPNQGAIIGIYY